MTLLHLDQLKKCTCHPLDREKTKTYLTKMILGDSSNDGGLAHLGVPHNNHLTFHFHTHFIVV